MITIGRVTFKVLSLVKEFIEKCHFFTPIDAMLFTLAPYTKMGNERKHKKIIEYISRYSQQELPKGYSLSNKIDENCPLWVFWYQGFDHAPNLIKAINRQLIKCKGEHNVILLDKENLSHYVCFPDYIWDKVNRGVISLTHFSDLIRMFLLSEYGGYWIDSTVLLSNPLPNYATSYYSIRNNQTSRRHVGGGKNWSAFFIGTGEKNAISKFILNMFIEYWKKENHMIDYFLIDYCTYIAFERFPYFKRLIVENPIDNPNITTMQDHLNDKYTSERWNQLFFSQTLHKLSYKLPLKNGNTIAYHIMTEL